MRHVPLLLATLVALSACSSVPSQKPDPEWIVIGASAERTYEVAMQTYEADKASSSSQFMLRTKLNAPIKTSKGDIGSVVEQVVVLCGDPSAVISTVRVMYGTDNNQLLTDTKPQTYIDNEGPTSAIHKIAAAGCVPFGEKSEPAPEPKEDWRKSA